MLQILLLFLACLVAIDAVAEDSALAEVFTRHSTEGTIVLTSLDTRQHYVHNDIRAARRLTPASTFKVFNTLIALEEKHASGKDEILRWNGKQYDLPAWNRDQTLESAFKVSCVWCYQELASRIGTEKYRKYLRQAAYGTLAESFELTTFWLDGALQISALEQVEFLHKLYRQSLPFSAPSYQALRQIMLVEQTPDYAIYAKTGWAVRSQPQIGWYVGYVESLQGVWIFAANIDIRGEADLQLRKKLVMESLIAKGLIH